MHAQDLYSHMICLPSPQPITSDLVMLGTTPDVARRLSLLYLQKAVAFKETTESIIGLELDAISRINGCVDLENVLQRLFTAHKRNYEDTLRQWVAEAADTAQSHFICQDSTRIDVFSISGGRTKSAPRFNTEYIPLFEYAFSKDRFPSREDKKHLSRISGMSYRQVSVWFQNRRCRSGKATPFDIRSEVNKRPKKRVRNGNSAKRTQSIDSFNPDYIVHAAHIDLTDRKNGQAASYPLSPEEFQEGKQEKFGSQSSNEQHNATPRTLMTDANCSGQFPAPYKPRAASVDSFTMKTDCYLRDRHCGKKRPKFSERMIKLDEIIRTMEAMVVDSFGLSDSTKGRDIKPLPRRVYASTSDHPVPRSPSAFLDRRRASSTAFSESSISSSDHISTTNSTDTSNSPESSDGHGDQHCDSIYSLENPSHDSLSSTCDILELSSSSYDSGEDYDSDSAFCQKGIVGAAGLCTSSDYFQLNIQNSGCTQKSEAKTWDKLLAVVPLHNDIHLSPLS